MANALGITKYGFKLQFSANGETSTKSYSGVNFTADTAQSKADTLYMFLHGGSNQTGLNGVITAMGSPYSLVGQSVTQENAATFT